jgi:hypothetical protein
MTVSPVAWLSDVSFDGDDQRIVSAIRQISGTESAAARSFYAAELITRFPDAVPPVRAVYADDDLAAIVHAYHLRDQGLSVLVEVLATAHGTSAQLEKLRWLVSLIDGPPTSLTGGHRDRLVDLLGGVDPGEIEGAARDSAPRLAYLRLNDPPDLDHLLRDLEDTIAAPGDPKPLVAFLGGLADRLRSGDAGNQTRADEVGALAQAFAGLLGGPPPTGRPPVPPPAEEPGPTFLVVRLRPDGVDSWRYLMDVWLNTAPDEWDPWWPERDRRLTIDEVEHELNTLIDRRSQATHGPVNEFMVEFILPPNLIEYPVDQWVVNGPGFPAPIGSHFPVMVRDLERMSNRFTRARWHRRCTWLRHHGGQVDGESVFWERLGPTHEPTELYGQLMRDRDRPACLVLLRGDVPERLPGAIRAAVTAGLPAVVWCRNESLETQFDRSMHQHLMGKGLLDLLLHIWQLRKDALTQPNAQHIGSHLTLLWDMASRVPPEDALQAPA